MDFAILPQFSAASGYFETNEIASLTLSLLSLISSIESTDSGCKILSLLFPGEDEINGSMSRIIAL